MSDTRPKRKKMPYLIIAVLLTAVSLAFTVMAIRLGVLPVRLLAIILAAVWVIVLLLDVLLLAARKWKAFWVVLSILMAAVLSAGIYYLYHTQKLVEVTRQPLVQSDAVSIYVLLDSPAESIGDTEGFTFGILQEIDRENTDKTIAELQEKVEFSQEYREYEDMLDLADALYEKTVDAIILNDAFVSVISDNEGYGSFPEDIRALLTTVQETVQPEIPVVEEPVMDGFFIAYISGIDTYGGVSKKSRSDVNILAAVNTKTKEILLLSTPRDYFIELSISGDKRDKLTHAGIYGVNVSMDTLGMLYDINVDYYVRMNFTGFTDIVNAIGGVNVYSEYEFTAGDVHFDKGYNELDGEQALTFARERHSFATGDNQRGKNQMEVIKAVIAKCSSPAVLTNYASLMSSMASTFETNVSNEQIAQLVDVTLFGGGSWHVTSYSVTGDNSSDYTYSMPRQRVYVMEPHWDSVEQAKALIGQVRAGETLGE